MLKPLHCALILTLLISSSSLWLAQPARADGCFGLSSLGTTYNQNFDTLANSGASSVTPNGWNFSEAGVNANTTYSAGTGSSNTGETYSFGAAGSTERALGGLRSGNLIPLIGACFTNNTGSTINTLTLSYTGEQWRLGATGRADRLDFQYSTDATSLTTGAWNNIDSLDFTAPVSGGTVGLLDGNAAANRVLLNTTLAGLAIANGADIWLRWNDLDATGADDGLAVDDFALTALNLVVSTSAGTTPDENGPTNGSFILSLNNPAPPGGLTVNYNLTGSTASNPADYSLAAGTNLTSLSVTTFTIAAGQNNATLLIVPVDDQIDDDGETVRLTLDSGLGYSLGAAATAAQTIADNDTRGLSISESGSSTTVTEGGAADTYTIQLATIPTDTVTLSFSTGPQIETITSLTFPANAAALSPQTVTVNATDDALVEGDHTGLIAHTITGGDYDGLSLAGVTAAIRDNDLAYTLTPTQLSLPEGSGADTPISFTLTRSGDITGSSSISFTLSGTASSGPDYSNVTPAGGVVNFSSGQTASHINMNVLGDFIDENNETITVTLFGASGTNPTGTGVISGSDSAAAIIIDDDSAGFTILPLSGPTSEDGLTATFTIRLTSQPLATVTIPLSSSDTTEGVVNPAALNFTPLTWNIPQTVTITGVDDPNPDGSINYTILLGPSSSSDPLYHNQTLPSVVVINLDNDSPPISPTGPLYLPFIVKNFTSGPDLVIDSLSAGSNGVTLVIRNAGTAPVVDAFWVDVYFNPGQTPVVNKPWQAIAAHGQVWGVTGAGLSQLTPGGTLTLTSGDAYFFSSESSPLPLPVGANVLALADSVNFSTSYGAVLESNEENNVSQPVVSTAARYSHTARQFELLSFEGLPRRQ